MNHYRLSTALATIAIAATTFASQPSSPPRLEGHTLSQVKPVESTFGLPTPQRATSMARTVTAADLNGKYFVQWDDIGGNSPRQGYDACTKVTFSGDSAYIENFYGLQFTARGKYDSATQTIQIHPQPAFIESPFGTFFLCPFDTERGGFYSDPTAHFDVSITSDGHLQGGSLGWVVVIADQNATFYGSAVGMSRQVKFKKTNATMSGNRRNIDALNFAPYEYPVYVEQTAPDDLLIANIATNGREVHMQLKPGYEWEMEPQIIMPQASGSTSGPACTFPAEWSATKNKSKGVNKNLTGEGDETTLDFGPWGVFRSNALLQCVFGMENSLLTLDSGVRIAWPTAAANDLQGEGTEQNPYLITSIDDLMKLARRVNAGEKFTGKFIRQTADINFANLSGRYYPIGSDKTNCFDGTYDGQNKIIRNMNIERGSNQYTGLFGYVDANAHIKNVDIVNARITSSGKYNGFIAGYCLGRIDNVKTNGLLQSTTEYNGGVAGYSCSVRNSQFIGQISGMASTGGITGELHFDTIANCRVSAAISSSIPNTIGHNVGGIAGGVYGSATAGRGFITDCYFLGSMTDNTGYAHQGCIAGTLSNYASATRCVAVGVMTTNVTKTSIGSCGGLVGSLSGGAIYDCYASASIQDPNESPKVGGIIGLGGVGKEIQPEVRNCIYTGQVRVQGIAAPAQAIHGTLSATSGVYPQFSNVIVDAQITGMDSEDSRLTSDLISGQVINGFDTDVWQFSQGRYPIIKNLLPENVTALATVPAILNGAEKITNVKNDITLGLHPSVRWSLYVDSKYMQETAGIKIEGDKAKLKGILSQEFLMVSLSDESLGGTFSRIYYLNVAPSQFEGEGTAQNPYLIKTVQDLKTLNTAITMNGITFEGDHFALTGDLDLKGVTDFYGIADDSKETHYFGGTFDGRGHSIKNWTLSGISVDADGKLVKKNCRQTAAFIGILGAKGTLKNLVMDSSCQLRGQAGMASAVAICYGKVENVRNYGSVTSAESHAAGIVARLVTGASVTNCYNAGVITAGTSYAAGLVAEMQAGTMLSNCQNDGFIHTDSITASNQYKNSSCASGLVGNSGGAATIVNCVNQGDISAPQESAGVISRCAAGTVIENCLTTGTLNIADKKSSFGAVVATNLADDTFKNVYYDGQINYQGAVNNSPYNGCNGLNTSLLISGQQLPGLSADLFDYQAGRLPVLKAFKDEAAARTLRSMTLVLADGDVVNEMSKAATVTSASGLQWSLKGEGFAISGTNVTLQNLDRPGVATLTATMDGHTRSFDMQSAHNPFTGAGTQADPYRLNSFADWKTLSEYTNTYGFRYEGKYFAMDRDVDFDSTVNFLPVAFNSANHFNGQIDGRNHRLNHVRIEWTDKNSPVGYENVGIISMLGRNGAVRNLTIGGRIRAFKNVGGLIAVSYGIVENCHNEAYVGTTNNTNTGGLVSSANGGAISSCTNRGSVVGNYTIVGGIASYVGYGVTVRDCANYGIVMAKDSISEKYYAQVGGVVGNCFGRIINCINRGSVVGNGSVGGVVSTGAYIDSCVNYSDITVPAGQTGNFIGGVASKTSSGGVMMHCYNYGAVSGNNYTGGVLGDAGSNSKISFCSNRAPVTGGAKAYTGGVVGDLSSGSSLDSCANYAEVKGIGTNSGYVGGVTGGGTSGITITNCVNYANVSSKGVNSYYVGGVTGACGGTISDCYNYGSVQGESYGVGGIGGYGSGHVFRCVNLGDVSTSHSVSTKKYGNAGGIWGTGAVEIRDCINYGDVAGIYYVGGIQGYPTGSTKISRVYFQGQLTGGDEATCCAIMHVDATQKNVKVDSAYYNSEVIGAFPTNDADAARCIPLITRELVNAPLGNAFDYHQYALPTLKVFAPNTDLNVAAAIVGFKDGENAGSFRTSARVELFPGAHWSVTPNMKMDGNKIYVVATKNLDPGTITVKGDRYSRTFNITTANGGTGVNGLDGERTPVSVKYFNIGGIEVVAPAPGTTVIERTVYSDGTSSTRKIVIRE